MADNHGFVKPVTSADDLQDDDGGIVSITGLLSYQMLPVGGVRHLGVIGLPDRACEVVIEKPIAEYGPRSFKSLTASGPFTAPDTPDRFRQILPAGMRMNFDLRGLLAGHTDIVLKSGGAPIASARIAVKSEVIVTISACRLSDIVTTNPFTEAEIRRCVDRAKTVYKNTANVSLVADPTIYVIESDIELGNPIILGRAFTEYDSEDTTVLRHIKAKIPPAARNARLICLFAWDFEIVHSPIAGLNIGNLCFVEWDASDFARNMTLEHELGHALGLPHTAIRSIMAGDGSNGLERFEADHIEILNTTGKTP